jgi:hypothetical protein
VYPLSVYTCMIDQSQDRTTAPWLNRLRTAVDAGYYRTESSTDAQEPFPWQNKTCGDCPFWHDSTCLVRLAPRHATDQTCSYFDAPNREAAKSIIDRRRRGDWWEEYFHNLHIR